jgi:hypothetical protein
MILERLERFEIEPFTSTNNSKIYYDENVGMFVKKNKSLLGLFNLDNKYSYEKDMSISKINEMREMSEITTLTKGDIDLLYEFAQMEFNYEKDLQKFMSEPLTKIFHGMDQNKLIMKNLMPTAYDYVSEIQKGGKPIIEKFTVTYRVNGVAFFVFCCGMMGVIFMYLAYLYYFKK